MGFASWYRLIRDNNKPLVVISRPNESWLFSRWMREIWLCIVFATKAQAFSCLSSWVTFSACCLRHVIYLWFVWKPKGCQPALLSFGHPLKWLGGWVDAWRSETGAVWLMSAFGSEMHRHDNKEASLEGRESEITRRDTQMRAHETVTWCQPRKEKSNMPLHVLLSLVRSQWIISP